MKQKNVESEIRKAITRHLVIHVQTPGDQRCRIDILVEEAAKNILKKSKIKGHRIFSRQK